MTLGRRGPTCQGRRHDRGTGHFQTPQTLIGGRHPRCPRPQGRRNIVGVTHQTTRDQRQVRFAADPPQHPRHTTRQYLQAVGPGLVYLGWELMEGKRVDHEEPMNGNHAQLSSGPDEQPLRAEDSIRMCATLQVSDGDRSGGISLDHVQIDQDRAATSFSPLDDGFDVSDVPVEDEERLARGFEGPRQTGLVLHAGDY